MIFIGHVLPPFCSDSFYTWREGATLAGTAGVGEGRVAGWPVPLPCLPGERVSGVPVAGGRALGGVGAPDAACLGFPQLPAWAP